MTDTSKQTHYEKLGVARDATTEEIKKAFRKLAREYHPDRLTHLSATDPTRIDADKKMKQLTQAYDVLSDTNKRRAYDLRPISDIPPLFTNARPDDGYDHSEYLQEHRRIYAEQLRRDVEIKSADKRVRTSTLFKMFWFILQSTRIMKWVTIGCLISVFVISYTAGDNVGAFIFTSSSQPESNSALPIFTGFAFVLLGGIVQFICQFYISVMVALHAVMPLPSVNSLVQLQRSVSAWTYIIPWFFSGLVVGSLLF
ncbi:MAG: Chaperone protein dnaJ [Candidatus Saccharibacteria bacterium]|nr:Chaperone protein dnaJ [Candidatus Saccharibacteria bacterium]MDB5180862.1 Chaperone protein dnaJ [Candidatus Saccharibacteria bacterium]